MPKITMFDGTESKEFVGFDFEEGTFYIGLLGEWMDFDVYIPCGASDEPHHLAGYIDDLYRQLSCGVRPIMTKGSVEVSPEDYETH